MQKSIRQHTRHWSALPGLPDYAETGHSSSRASPRPMSRPLCIRKVSFELTDGAFRPSDLHWKRGLAYGAEQPNKERMVGQVSIVNGRRDLDMWEWAVAESSEIVETGGASSCAIVAVLNHTQGRAWMIHQPAPYMNSDEVEDMLGDAACAEQAGDEVQICLAGCKPGGDYKKDRAKLIELAKLEFSTVTPDERWNKQCLSVKYDPSAQRWICDYNCP